jgi:enhancing lycopene biosynthesis protein 2
VLTLLALSRHGASVQCLAPNVAQRRVFDHAAGRESDATRNVLTEAARIARGEIEDIATANLDDYDAAILPGGFGAALNLSSYAIAGADMAVETHTKSFLLGMARANKPLAALCIAPPILARVMRELGREGAKVTVGVADGPDGQNLSALGAVPVDCKVTECVVDAENKLVTSPAYMCEANLAQLAEGIDNSVRELLALIN